ncbi:metalloregulator ArsR/SmtB family transcription factor [Clostridium estertheticum]|uniref:ArsR/SmtB family transcription factor n=1 Tax=Clostridium estertheticum TaxID=238834 RepID=UPI001C6F2A91|nr:metalloregulator ArsR/SmtB family transcription factor [Clostridium estertheticum]MBW9150721.1 metalloregulator ArsR/SmtB family transcription factor [Clostridium estertheticum]MCB2305114.1 metalloregulator ArsR/SmtB family transcription factor [Clostridium estertheticum]MCB2343616.1 metalloregulator ArsR/SmtB family transcription factor [Clostridium estertheticum]MCB2348536.1 metalloregulator ArsR/SmtB family transcription factor [Clostridium estertheticum]WAG47480.1 metalloregulator ArsR/
MDTDYMKYIEITDILKVLAHPIRMCLVKSILDQGQCNVSHMQTCLKVPQSTVSQHLQKLRYAGVIEGHRNGLEVNYKIRDERIKKLINSILLLS